jgi:DNA primase
MLRGKDDLEAREFVMQHESLALEPFENLDKGDEPLSTLSAELVKKFCPAHLGLDIVKQRGITQETIDRFHLRYDSKEGRLVFPVYTSKGALVGFRGRTTAPSNLKYREYSELLPKKQSLKGNGIWFGMQFVPSPTQKIILVEGEMDAVKLSQALGQRAGVWAAMGASISNEQIKTILAVKNPVLLFFDNDEAGIAAKNKLISKLSKLKPGIFVVTTYLNHKDPDEIATAGRLKQVLQSIEQVA